MADPAASEEPFTRAYCALRDELAKVSRPPGSQIRVDETARELSISPTPVREALAMLAGERLVHSCRRRGFFVPKPSANDLVQLYILSEMYLLTAVHMQSAQQQTPISIEFEAAAKINDGCSVARVFIAILARAESSSILDYGALIIERLAPARLAESPDLVDRERDELASLVEGRRFAELAKTIRSYHRVRRAMAIQTARVISAVSAPGRRYIPDMV